MKLDLLYEVDAPQPWDEGPHPYGQRKREQRAYREALEQIKLADSLGFHTIWAVEHHFRAGRSHCPAPEVLLGGGEEAYTNKCDIWSLGVTTFMMLSGLPPRQPSVAAPVSRARWRPQVSGRSGTTTR